MGCTGGTRSVLCRSGLDAMAWTVETLNETVDTELANWPADMRARLVRICELVEQVMRVSASRKATRTRLRIVIEREPAR